MAPGILWNPLPNKRLLTHWNETPVNDGFVRKIGSEMVKRGFTRLDWTIKKLPHTIHLLGNGILPMYRGSIEQNTTREFAPSVDAALYNFNRSLVFTFNNPTPEVFPNLGVASKSQLPPHR